MIAKLLKKEELGQGLAEYCLLTALLLLIGLGIFIHLSGGIESIWGNANTALSTSGQAGSHTNPTPGGGH